MKNTGSKKGALAILFDLFSSQRRPVRQVLACQRKPIVYNIIDLELNPWKSFPICKSSSRFNFTMGGVRTRWLQLPKIPEFRERMVVMIRVPILEAGRRRAGSPCTVQRPQPWSVNALKEALPDCWQISVEWPPNATIRRHMARDFSAIGRCQTAHHSIAK